MDSGLFGFFNLIFLLRLKSLHIFGILLRAFGTEKNWMQVYQIASKIQLLIN